MTRTVLAVGIMVALALSALSASAGPLNSDTSYAAYRQGPCDRCVLGVKPALSSTYWLESATVQQRYPQKPWLTIRVNGRDTNLGPEAWVLDGELMLPVMAATDFGLTPTRSGLNHRLITLSGGRYLVRLSVGSRHAEVGYRQVRLPVSPKWHNGKLYMPIQTLAKLLEWESFFNGRTGVLSVNTKDADLVSHRRAGEAALARNMFDEAIKAYEQAIALDPEDWWLRRRLGEAQETKARRNEDLALAHRMIGEALQRVVECKQLAEKQPATGMAEYVEAVRRAAERVKAYRALSARSYPFTNVREPDEALDIYERTLFTGPATHPVPRVSRTSLISYTELNAAVQQATRSEAACAQRARDSMKAALASYQEALRRAPASLAGFKALAEDCLRSGDAAEAAENLRRALALDPKSAETRLELAQALIGQGKYEEAAREAQSVLDTDPHNAAAYNVLGYALRRQGREKFEQAAEAYRAAIKLAPQFALAHNNLGVVLLGLGKKQEAVNSFSKATSLAPDRADFQGNLALALYETGRLRDAARAWAVAVARDPDNPEYHAFLALAKQELGDPDGAIAEARLALQRQVGAVGGDAITRQEAAEHQRRAQVIANCALAWARLEKGRVTEALAAAQDAVRLAPEDARAQGVLAAVATETLDLQTGTTAAQRAVTADPDTGLYRAIAAAAAALAGQTEAATAHLAEAAKLLKSVEYRWANYFTGKAYAALGDVPKAVAAFRRPQPVAFDPIRRANIADYLARYSAKPPTPPPPPQSVPSTVPTAEAATEGQVEVACVASSDEQPSLTLLNKTGKPLTVILEREGNKQVWGLPARAAAGPRPLPPGTYKYAIQGLGETVATGSQEFIPRQAYTLTVSGQVK